MMSVILGVDPGLSGALAFMDADGNIETIDMPVHRLKRGGKVRRELNLSTLARLIDDRASGITHAYVELAGARPGQGVSSMFNFGRTYGATLGILAANFVPVTTVASGRWKRSLGVPAAKDGSRARASELMPRHAGLWIRVRDDGRAEAAMIALYGARELGRIEGVP
jgi:crossover junction endodeoxyribonuclease RuvC